jgi:prepilin-type N-terminal cleavage/methylation domain-containing protein
LAFLLHGNYVIVTLFLLNWRKIRIVFVLILGFYRGENDLEHQKLLRKQDGFTLIEIIAVLIILSLLAAVAVPRYIDLEQDAKQSAIDAVISELNGREGLTWVDLKISPTGYQNDALLLLAVDYNLGIDTGGTLNFKGESVALNRSQSDASQPAVWSR